jgi:ribosomal protein L13E
MYNATLRHLKKMDSKKTEGGRKTERPRMLVHKFRRMEKTKINYGSARHNDTCKSNS